MVMESYIQLSFVSAIFLLLCSTLPLTHQQSPLFNSCSSDRGNFTANSSFSSNLDRLSSALASAAPSPGGFYNFSIGESPDQVNSIALCRGDVSSAACLSCITNATVELRSRCPNQKEAIIFYDSCMFRYSNRSILGSPETGQIFYMWNPNNASNVENFNRVLSDLLDGLTTRAAGGGSVRKFATGSASAGTFQTIYALVQCTPDLSQLQCSSCLSGNIGQIPTCCDGKIGGRVIVPSCNLRYEVGPFYDPSADAPSSSSSPPPPPSTVDAAPSPSNETRSAKGGNSNSTRTVIIIVAVAAVAVILILGGGTFIFCRVRKPRQRVETAEDVADGIGASDALQYDFETIRAATNDFAPANKLGQGGFGPVYKGLLGGGQEIAVKRLSRGSGQGDLEFKNEVMLVAKLQHRNLVRLLGFSLQGNEKLLVYEFVPNASLDHFLFDPFKRRELDWERRSKIIGGIARGLLYLHEDSRLRIIHRDLKASNILLDAEMNPKISDFGMAKLFALDQSQYATSRIVGTYGYMAPEYAMHGQFSVKSDVFSFGVLILEILSGQRINCFRNGGNVEDLLSCAWRNWRQGTALDFVDQTLRDSSRTELLRCIHIGLLCVQENAVDRPNMASVALMLTSYSVTLPMPSEPAFWLQSSTQSEVSTSGGHHSGSDESLRDQIAPMVADVGDLSSELDPR